jgi:RimJ/RimL family protein N-acetyltransferase
MPPGSETRADPRAAVLETRRLVLRRLSTDDAPFLLELLNEPSFLRYIGDKGVRTEADAVRYVETGPVASYERFGFGLWRVELKESGQAVGMCGLLKRDTLPDVDVGFAFLPRHWSKGYAFESASAVVAHAREALGLKRVVAITSPDNVASIRLLEKLGFRFERMARVPEDGPEVMLFGLTGPAEPDRPAQRWRDR